MLLKNIVEIYNCQEDQLCYKVIDDISVSFVLRSGYLTEMTRCAQNTILIQIDNKLQKSVGIRIFLFNTLNVRFFNFASNMVKNFVAIPARYAEENIYFMLAKIM